MKKINNILFKEDIKHKDVVYKNGFAYKLNLEQADIDCLLRQGCIYAEKDAKYYEEPKVKPVVKQKDEIVDVIDKDIKQAKVQTRHSDKSKSKK